MLKPSDGNAAGEVKVYSVMICPAMTLCEMLFAIGFTSRLKVFGRFFIGICGYPDLFGLFIWVTQKTL